MAPRLLLILDSETTGLSPATERVIELACTLYSVEHRCAITSFSALLNNGEGNAAEAINRIPPDALKLGRSATGALAMFVTLANACDAYVAHRVDFDRPFVEAMGTIPARPWICSKFDIEWPRQQSQGEHLVHLALAHGVGIVNAHRAASDVDTLCRLFQRVAEMGTDIDALLARAMRPKSLVVSLAPFESKDVVKAHGFAWDAGAREWTRRMATEDVAALPFKHAIREAS